MWRWLEALGASAGESDDDRAQRVGLVGVVVAGIGASFVFAGLAVASGYRWYAAMDVFAAAALAAMLARFASTRDFRAFVLGLSGLLLVLPAVHAQEDGVQGGGLVVTALAPVLAAVFLERRVAIAMLAAQAPALALMVAASVRVSAVPLEAAASQAINVLVVTAVLVALIAYLAQARREAARALAAEHQRSEALLLNVLPAPIAARLKDSPGAIADQFDEVTILFADIVGFTPLAATLPPRRVVEILGELFGRFDLLAEAHGLEKIKTIGDAYLVVGGLPSPRPDHARAVAAMGVDMIAAVRAFSQEAGLALDVRVGVDSGPVVAGVIGRKKFAYDLWGDAVNVASRMESHGVAGRVHLGPGARARLLAHYDLESRGVAHVKGKGDMETWLLGPPRG